MKNNFKKNSLGYKFIIPGLIIIMIVMFIPISQSIYYSFSDYTLSGDELSFVGLSNYSTLFNDKEFHSILGFTFLYTFTAVALTYGIGLIVALILNQKIKFRNIFRALVLLPWVIPVIAAALSWKWVLDYHYGLANTLLVNLKIVDKPLLFLADKTLARVIVIVMTSWKNFPFFAVVLLAGLQGIPEELYEAASIDGANVFNRFRYITMPALKNVSLIITMLSFFWTFSNFEYIWLLTEGDPARSTFVLPILTYYIAFFRGEMGYASAIAVIILIVLLLVSFAYLRLQKSNVITK